MDMVTDRGGPGTPLLSLDGLTRHFPIKGGLLGRTVANVRAVDGVAFEVIKGETLGIVGESGCGKSTTARLLMRLLEPDAGTMVFDGEAVGEPRAGGLSLRDYRRQVQMVFQDSYASLNPRLPIEDSIAFAPIVHGLSRGQANARAREILAAVGLAPAQFARRYPTGLLNSTVHGNMRGRVLTTFPGAPPSLSTAPAGCSFAPRCTLAEAACDAGVPPMVEAGGDRRARCIKLSAG